MEFDKQKALDLAKKFSSKFNEKDVRDFIEKHKDLELITNVKLLFSMANDSIKGKYKIDKMTFAAIAGALAYTAIPTDLIPDFIPGIGFIDDAFVIGWTVNSIKDEIEKYKRFINDKTGEAE